MLSSTRMSARSGGCSGRSSGLSGAPRSPEKTTRVSVACSG